MPTLSGIELYHDLFAAFGGDTFQWDAGAFSRSRTYHTRNDGYVVYYPNVEVSHQRRDALLRAGVIEAVEDANGGTVYRLTARTIGEVRAYLKAEWRGDPPSTIALREFLSARR